VIYMRFDQVIGMILVLAILGLLIKACGG